MMEQTMMVPLDDVPEPQICEIKELPPRPPLELPEVGGSFTWTAWNDDGPQQQWLQKKCRDAGTIFPAARQNNAPRASRPRKDPPLTYSWKTNDSGRVRVSLPLSVGLSSTGGAQLDVQLRLVEVEWRESDDKDNCADSAPTCSLPFARHASSILRMFQTTAFVGLAKLLLPEQHRMAWRYVGTLGLLEPAACAVGWAARAAAGQLQSNWGLRNTWMLVYNRMVETQQVGPAQQIASHGCQMLSQAAREAAIQLLIPTLAIAASQLLWEILHPASFQIAASMVALYAVSTDYNRLSKACRTGKIAAGHETELAWHACHKRNAQRLAHLQTDLSSTAPLAPLLTLMDRTSIAAGVVVDGVPFYGGLDTSCTPGLFPLSTQASSPALQPITHQQLALQDSAAATLQPRLAYHPQLQISASFKLPTRHELADHHLRPISSLQQASMRPSATWQGRVDQDTGSQAAHESVLERNGSSVSSRSGQGFITDSSASSQLVDVDATALQLPSASETVTVQQHSEAYAGVDTISNTRITNSRSVVTNLSSQSSQLFKSGRSVINISAFARGTPAAPADINSTSVSTTHVVGELSQPSTSAPQHVHRSRLAQGMQRCDETAPANDSIEQHSPFRRQLRATACHPPTRSPQGTSTSGGVEAGWWSWMASRLSWTSTAVSEPAAQAAKEEKLSLFGIQDHDDVVESSLTVWDIIPLACRALYLAAVFAPFLTVGLALLLLALILQQFSKTSSPEAQPTAHTQTARLNGAASADSCMTDATVAAHSHIGDGAGTSATCLSDSHSCIGQGNHRDPIPEAPRSSQEQDHTSNCTRKRRHSLQESLARVHARLNQLHSSPRNRITPPPARRSIDRHAYQSSALLSEPSSQVSELHSRQHSDAHSRPDQLLLSPRHYATQPSDPHSTVAHRHSQLSPYSPGNPTHRRSATLLAGGHHAQTAQESTKSSEAGKPVWLSMREASWQLLVGGCRLSGAAFIKWAQWAATRADLFPDDFCSALSKLQDGAPTHSMAHTRRTVEKAFGKKLSELFVSFEETPLASGSIAQVHKAVLRVDEEYIDVVVKVVHPTAIHSICSDFKLLKPLAGLVGCIKSLRGLHLRETMSQFSHTMTAQVDMRVEAAHLQRFCRNFRAFRGSVVFPEPIMHLVAKDVLVETFQVGQSVRDFMKRPGPFNTQIVAKGVDTYLKMLLKDNFIHTDLHPGNIMVRPAASGTQTHRSSTRKSSSAAGGRRERHIGHGGDSRHISAGKHGAAGTITSSTTGSTAGVGGGLAVEKHSTGEEDDLFAELWRFQEGRAAGPPPPAQLVLLDCGLAEQLTPTVRMHFVSLLNHISGGNGAAAARHVLQWSRPQTCPNPQAFTQAMVSLFDRSCNIHSPEGINLDGVMKSIMRLVREYEVAVDSSYATLVISICVLLGFATSLDPGVNLMDAATPALLAYTLTGRVMGRLYQ